MSIKKKELEFYLNEYLNIKEFQDYCPNGLQVVGTDDIQKIAFAVSATKESIEQAVKHNVDALITHHGLFWKFHGTKTITGPFSKRIIPLIRNDINLFGYHLPLDAHMDIGNAAVIAKSLDMTKISPFGDYKGSPTGVQGHFNSPIKATELKDKIAKLTHHHVLHSCYMENKDEVIHSLGIITGGANSDWKIASRLGLDAYLTGEMSEHDFHESREDGVHMFAAGHNATEVFGVKALMRTIESKFKIHCLFIDSNNPA